MRRVFPSMALPDDSGADCERNMTGPNGGVGVFGELCKAKTQEGVLPSKNGVTPPRAAVCNRWAQHDGLHRMTRHADFVILHEFDDDAVAVAGKKGSK